MIPLTFAIKLGRGILDEYKQRRILIMFMILTLLSVHIFCSWYTYDKEN